MVQLRVDLSPYREYLQIPKPLNLGSTDPSSRVGRGKLIYRSLAQSYTVASRAHNEEECVTSGAHVPGGNLSVCLN